MINESQLKSYCCGDYTEIENYADAVADTTQTWEIHHRKGLKYSMEDLIKNGEYYNRPSSELIFLTQSEHLSLHAKARKGSKNPFYGKVHSDSTKEKMSESKKGIPLTAEHCAALSKAQKGRKRTKGALGMHWYNNGIENKLTYDCPDGFVKGRLKNW